MDRRDFLKAMAISSAAFVLPNKVFANEIMQIPNPTSKLLMVIWDGCERTRVKTLMSAGLLPNLALVASQGSIVGVETVARTCTKPAHACIITGYGPNETLVYDNKMWSQMPAGLSIMERLFAHFGPNFRVFWNAGKPQHVAASELTSVFHCVDEVCFRCTPDADRHPDETGDYAVRWLENFSADPGFWFIHFREPDQTGHQYGEASDEYSAMIIRLDWWLGRMLAVCPSDMAIMVLTDHGFDIGGPHKYNKHGELKCAHYHAPKAWVACNRPLVRGGTLLDVAPTVYELFGVDVNSFPRPLLGDSLFHQLSMWGNEEPKSAYSIV